MAEDRKVVLARITGRVQGVSFRAWTRSEAEALGLSGWVRNEADGSVVALIVGTKIAVSHMVERLHVGPPGASVEQVYVEDADPGFAPRGFRITG